MVVLGFVYIRMMALVCESGEVPPLLRNKIMNTNNNSSLFNNTTPFRMHSVSYFQTPVTVSNFGGMQPRIVLNRLKLSSAKSFHMPSASVSKCFHQGPRVRLHKDDGLSL